VLLVEDSGAARRGLRNLLDCVVWVQADTTRAGSRLLERDGDTAEVRSFIADWAAVERPLMAAERVWEHADVIVLGTAESGRDDVLMVGGRTSGSPSR
jgi:hypothetical protein